MRNGNRKFLEILVGMFFVKSYEKLNSDFYISFIYSSKQYLFDYVKKQFGWEKSNTFNNNNRELLAYTTLLHKFCII